MKPGIIPQFLRWVERKADDLSELLFGHDKMFGPDPVKHCKVYKQHGCAHVDGHLCDMRTCEIQVKSSAITTPNGTIFLTPEYGAKEKVVVKFEAFDKKVELTVRPENTTVSVTPVEESDEVADEPIVPIAQTAKPINFMLNRIVCAANRSPDGILITSARHWDEAMHATYDKLKSEYMILDDYIDGRPEFPEGHEFEQGFIDKFGQFKTRTEAWVIAEAAGQIIREVGGNATDGGTLYSENLY